MGEEFGEVVADEFPFDVDVAGLGEAGREFGDVRSEGAFDDWDDLDWRRVFAGGVDLAAVAEGFEEGNFADGVESVEFGEGFGKRESESVDRAGGFGVF